NLSWSVIGAEKVLIHPGVGAVDIKGTVRVEPNETTEYRITALNGTENRSMTLKIMVDRA
ncbi:MAG: hypothetical protein WBL87_10475, partial [Methanothrix sp.]